MAEIAQEVLGLPTAMEISILNVDKPALDYLEIDRRLGQFPPEQAVWLTRAATFDDKSRLFPGATFVVGVDTLRRIADPRYYGNDHDGMLQAIERIVARGLPFPGLRPGRGVEFHPPVGPRSSRRASPGVPRDSAGEVPRGRVVDGAAKRRNW